MLKDQNDGGNRDLRSKGSDKTGVDVGGSDVLESTRNGAEDLYRILSFDATMAAIKPCSKSQDDHNEGIPQN